MLKKLHQPPHPKLERFALLFFSVAVVFATLSVLPPWKNGYEQTASATLGFASIYTASVQELGSQSAAVAQSELNVSAALYAWTSYLAGILNEVN